MADPNESPTMQSRLARVLARGGSGPVRGVGSAYAANQKVAGAQDPEAAALLASMPQAEMQEAVEKMEKENADLDEMRGELLQATAQSTWRPKTDKDVGNWEEAVNKAPPALLRSWYSQWLAYVEAGTDEKDGTQQDDPFKLAPDHPAYQPIMDTARRRATEAKLKKMEFGDLIFKGYAEQEVPVRSDFSFVFRSIGTTHGLWLEQRVTGDSRYDGHLFSLWQLAVGIHKYGGKDLGVDISSFDDKDAFYAEVDKRMKVVGRWPMELSNDVIVHYIWFTGRVRKLLHGNLTERVGN